MLKDIKELILEKTFLLLLEKGYERISVSDIQNGLGISRGLLYRYFKSKDDLVENSCRRYFVDRFLLSSPELDKLSFIEVSTFMYETMVALLVELEKKCGCEISVLKYNLLFADIVMRSESFRKMACSEFSVGRKVIENAKKRGEISAAFSTDFILNVSFDILARVTSTLDDENAIRKRMLSDLEEFHKSIKA